MCSLALLTNEDDGCELTEGQASWIPDVIFWKRSPASKNTDTCQGKSVNSTEFLSKLGIGYQEK